MGKKVKVVGYAQRVFFNDGIEYRNFSDDLVGQQLTSDGGSPLLTNNNFNITTNLEPKLNKIFLTNPFSKYSSLETLGLVESELSNLIDDKLKLNLDPTKLNTFAYFGSAKEFIRVSLEEIIMDWVASLYVQVVVGVNTGNTVTNYTYDSINNVATFNTPIVNIDNKYGINYFKTNSIQDDGITNELRVLDSSFTKYDISASTGEFKVIGFTGASNNNKTTLAFKVEGNPFPNFNGVGFGGVNYHIKPNKIEVSKFFKNLNSFKKHLLNRKTYPKYRARFEFPVETSNGTIILSEKEVTWPTGDGYNLDFDNTKYVLYVSELINIADNLDENNSDLIHRFLTTSAIHDFDSIGNCDGTEEETAGQKATKLLRIYGRGFDEIKKYIDGISFVNTITYNKRNNSPDKLVKNLARVMGWDTLSTIQDNDILTDLLINADSTYSGQSLGLTKTEAEIEFWRRLILNTPWLWKSKGSRKAIEFIFKFIGAPEDLISFNEYVYVAEDKLDMNLVNDLLLEYQGDNDLSNHTVDDEGYPKPLPNRPNMYFQNDGLWYRETGGPNAIVDILEGNNPHIGPYDGGFKYINRFENDIISGFSSTTVVETNIISGITNLFTNYEEGTMYDLSDSGLTITPDVLEPTLNTNIQCFEVQGTFIDDPVSSLSGDFLDDCLILNVTKKEIIYDNDDTGGGTGTTGTSCTDIYSDFELGDDGIVIFTYKPNGDTGKQIPPDCCTALGYTPEIDDNTGLTFCRWRNDSTVCSDIFSGITLLDNGLVEFNYLDGTSGLLAPSQCCTDLGYQTGIGNPETDEFTCRWNPDGLCREYRITVNIDRVLSFNITDCSTRRRQVIDVDPNNGPLSICSLTRPEVLGDFVESTEFEEGDFIIENLFFCLSDGNGGDGSSNYEVIDTFNDNCSESKTVRVIPEQGQSVFVEITASGNGGFGLVSETISAPKTYTFGVDKAKSSNSSQNTFDTIVVLRVRPSQTNNTTLFSTSVARQHTNQNC